MSADRPYLDAVELVSSRARALPPDSGFRPLGSKVLVLLDEDPGKAGSIFIPDAHREKERTWLATVAAVGPGEPIATGEVKSIARMRDGVLLPCPPVWARKPQLVKRGDRVLLNRYGGPEVELKGVKYMVVDDTDIKAVLE